MHGAHADPASASWLLRAESRTSQIRCIRKVRDNQEHARETRKQAGSKPLLIARHRREHRSQDSLQATCASLGRRSAQAAMSRFWRRF